MSLLSQLNVEVLEYAKSMPECGMAEDSDFEVWGKAFCEKMVSFRYFACFDELKTTRTG